MADSTPATFVRPIAHAWVSTGGTAAQNYDEFSSYDEITAIVQANPSSILSVDMPHCAPEDRAAGHSFTDALPAAAERLAGLKADGKFVAAPDVVLPYRITTASGVSYGVWAMVATEEISAHAGDPGRVIRNEDVFVDKVRERMALTETLDHLISAVLLLQTDNGEQTVELLREWTGARAPALAEADQFGFEHAVWLMGPSAERDRLLELLSGAELIVADGNHRSLAAQEAKLPEFLAVLTSPQCLAIQPYNRLIRSLGIPPAEFLDRLRGAGFDVAEASEVRVPAAGGRITVYLGAAGTYDVGLPPPGPDDASAVDRLDHTVVERALFRGVLGLDPADEAISYIGGDYPAGWLRQQVDEGRAEAAILIAPVTTEDFVRVNTERMKMPRKSTWFTPKARAGLVLAELG